MGTFHNISSGLDLPITGSPLQELGDAKLDSPQTHVALMAEDYFCMKPKMHCKVGDEVKRGQLLFEDRKNEGVKFTAPAAGKITAINRGEKRAFQSLVIELSETERQNNGINTQNNPDSTDFTTFENFQSDMSEATSDQIRALLIESGLWTRLRSRPFCRTPEVDSNPSALFITCTESDPLSPNIEHQVDGRVDDIISGVKFLIKMLEGTDAKTFVCTEQASSVPNISGTETHRFTGKHPYGLVGTHMAKLYPVTRKRVCWYIHAQDVADIGFLLRTGRLNASRVISIGGPMVSNPRLLKTRIGASIDKILENELKSVDDEEGNSVVIRTISGSCLSGRTAKGDVLGYLGIFHRQITALGEGTQKEFIGWLLPGVNKFSTIPTFVSALFSGKLFDFTTTTNGEHREMVPIGMYERVMPLDIMPTFLLRALEIGDLDNAEKLGALELDAEDLSLCSFVCPGKADHGSNLRKALFTIWKEG